MKKTSAPFGRWESELTPALIANKLRFSDVQYTADGLVWLEGRSTGSLLMHLPDSGAGLATAPSIQPRSGLAYGGGEFSTIGNSILYVNKDTGIHRTSSTADEPGPISHGFGNVSSPCSSPDGRYILFLHSDGKEDSIGLVDTQSQGWPIRLIFGADFYMQPVWNPAGDTIAWVEWNIPNMAWDGSVIKTARFDPASNTVSDIQTIAGDAGTPVFQPEFSPDSKYLSFLQGAGDRDKLVILDLQSGSKTTLLKDMVLIPPAWVHGMRVYGWTTDSRKIYCICQQPDGASIYEIQVGTGIAAPVDLAPYCSFSQISTSPKDDSFACIASASLIPGNIIRWKGGKVAVVRSSLERNFSAVEIPSAQPVSWKNGTGETIYGLYSPPLNSRYESDGLPPAIIHVHGGPTSQVDGSFSFDTAFFTNRGYGILVVNYRGSSGYSRSYQQALNHQWGQVDVEDTVSAAGYLVENGLANPDQLVIKGGSAGGYTLLNTVIRYPGLFRAAVCSYPVANLLTIIAETFKFEAHYYDSLIGPYPEEKAKYIDWSPITHKEKIRTPMILFHGDADPVVPPSQSAEIAAALQENGVQHVYKVFSGEGHGWKKAETLETYYSMIESFLKDFALPK